jgi:hypothetical protein
LGVFLLGVQMKRVIIRVYKLIMHIKRDNITIKCVFQRNEEE